MRRHLAVLAVASAFAAAAACSSSSSSDDGSSTDSGAPETTPSDGPTLDDIQTPMDSGNVDPISDDFEDPGQCGDWLPEGATLTWRPGGAHNSMGACEICTTDGGTMYRTVVVPSGSYTLDALVAREDGGTGNASWTESLAFQHADNSDAGFVQGTGAATFTFATAETKGSTADGVRIIVRIGRTGGTDTCMLVDDVKLVAR